MTLSPVFASASKPGYGPALGLSGLSRLCHLLAADPATAPSGHPLTHRAARDPATYPAARGPATYRAARGPATYQAARGPATHPAAGGPATYPAARRPATRPAGAASADGPVDVPAVYALAGVRPDDVAGCLAAGAAGVAVMGAVMRDPRIVHDYLAALREERQ